MTALSNPFKFGTIVDGDYFTDRAAELLHVKQVLSSVNHLVIISPRRFGKSSLVNKALSELPRHHISINLQSVTSVEQLSGRLLEALFRIYPMARLKHYFANFRLMPTITVNPISGEISVSFSPSASSHLVLEDVMSLLDKANPEHDRLIVVLDEFQEIFSIDKNLDRTLRAIMQEQHHINYVLLGSQESMMEQIFERKKSPFYHFGELMRLSKIPYDNFHSYISQRIDNETADEILAFTNCHPYYTQQLSFQVWNLIHFEKIAKNVTELAIQRLVSIHDLDFERLWVKFNKSDRRVLQELCKEDRVSILSNKTAPTSTTFSALKRLMQQGYVVRDTRYEIEDPFFKRWILKN